MSWNYFCGLLGKDHSDDFLELKLIFCDVGQVPLLLLEYSLLYEYYLLTYVQGINDLQTLGNIVIQIVIN